MTVNRTNEKYFSIKESHRICSHAIIQSVYRTFQCLNMHWTHNPTIRIFCLVLVCIYPSVFTSTYGVSESDAVFVSFLRWFYRCLPFNRYQWYRVAKSCLTRTRLTAYHCVIIRTPICYSDTITYYATLVSGIVSTSHLKSMHERCDTYSRCEWVATSSRSIALK